MNKKNTNIIKDKLDHIVVGNPSQHNQLNKIHHCD